MTVCFTNGCYDILHIGHIRMLKYCHELAEKVVVGIDSDERVKTLKGSQRPFNTQKDRAEMLLALRYVDHVEIFNSDDELIELVAKHKPQFMVVGEEYRTKTVIGGHHAQEGKYFRRIGEYSTTNILQDFATG